MLIKGIRVAMRLTEKNETGFVKDISYFPSDELENKSEIEISKLLLAKLGQLEDIEECVDKGIWYAFGGSIMHMDHVVTDFKQIGIIYDRGILWLQMSERGTKWGLTKEELKSQTGPTVEDFYEGNS